MNLIKELREYVSEVAKEYEEEWASSCTVICKKRIIDTLGVQATIDPGNGIPPFNLTC